MSPFAHDEFTDPSWGEVLVEVLLWIVFLPVFLLVVVAAGAWDSVRRWTWR